MSISLPSREIYVADIPEPIKFDVSFRYNFFVPDEGKSETGGISARYLKKSSDELGSDFIDYASTRVPRFNVIKWTVPKVTSYDSLENQQRKNNNESTTKKDLIRNNLKKIITENDLSSYDYFSIVLDDPEIDEKIFQYVSSSMLQHLEGDDEDDVSHVKTAARLGAKLPGYIDAEFLKGGLGQPDKAFGARFFNGAGTQLDNNKWSDIKLVNVLAQLNSKLIHSMISRTIADPHSPYTLEFQDLLETSSRLTSYMKQKSITGLDENDFRAFVPYVDVNAGDKENTRHSTSVKLVGYIIDKIEHFPDGSTKNHSPIIVENSKIHLTTDLRVKYGATYTYAIRTVALFTMPAIDDDTNDVASISFLISSRPSNRIVIKCAEEISPPPPADINFTWNYETDKMMVHWVFPPNSQRDIKQFQVFRRESLKDPFELIKVYNFNDAVVQDELTIHHIEANINQTLVEEIKTPVTYYIDDDFEKNSKFIYTVCSIDAHGLTSNYGAQYLLSFDVFKNKIVKSLISHSGAPKGYPNLYLEADLFQDTIRVSGPHSKRMKIYFSPEFYSLTDNKRRETSLISTKQEGGSYVLQFINVERQKSSTIKIEIDDKRSGKRVSKEKLT